MMVMMMLAMMDDDGGGDDDGHDEDVDDEVPICSLDGYSGQVLVYSTSQPPAIIIDDDHDRSRSPRGLTQYVHACRCADSLSGGCWLGLGPIAFLLEDLWDGWEGLVGSRTGKDLWDVWDAWDIRCESLTTYIRTCIHTYVHLKS